MFLKRSEIPQKAIDGLQKMPAHFRNTDCETDKRAYRKRMLIKWRRIRTESQKSVSTSTKTIF